MNIGDLVLRAYKESMDPGMVVDEVSETIYLDDGDEYIEHHYVVSWPDGTLTKETIWELDRFETICKEYKDYLDEQEKEKE